LVLVAGEETRRGRKTEGNFEESARPSTTTSTTYTTKNATALTATAAEPLRREREEIPRGRFYLRKRKSDEASLDARGSSNPQPDDLDHRALGLMSLRARAAAEAEAVGETGSVHAGVMKLQTFRSEGEA
jgi:hypothetical protein